MANPTLYDFTLTTLDGEERSLVDYRGRNAVAEALAE